MLEKTKFEEIIVDAIMLMFVIFIMMTGSSCAKKAAEKKEETYSYETAWEIETADV